MHLASTDDVDQSSDSALYWLAMLVGDEVTEFQDTNVLTSIYYGNYNGILKEAYHERNVEVDITEHTL